MQKNYKKCGAMLLALLLLGTAVLSLSSCGQAWDWLWSRDDGADVDTDRLILGGEIPEGDTELIFEGAVEYTGDPHSGTDIYYLGKKGSPNRSRIIVIDAGHQLRGSSVLEPNGPNSDVMKAEVTAGSTGVSTGQTEYDLNLAVALLLRDELIRRGYSVVMIRETHNVHISNMARAEIANKYSAAAFIRIHANGWTDETMRGATTICQTANNPYPTCAVHYERSYQLSRFILDEFCGQTGISKMAMQETDNMTGTNWSQVPTTILEMGFLSNRSEDRLMSTDFFRQEAAIGVANGLDAYFEWLDTQLPTWDSVEQVTSPKEPAKETAPETTVPSPENTTEALTAENTEALTTDASDVTLDEPAENLTDEPTEDPDGESTQDPPEESEMPETTVPEETSEALAETTAEESGDISDEETLDSEAESNTAAEDAPA
ncbi:MAG: N-acetylmuramoyl-L-alanine amidase [Clostridia bacterium]|nr:N-acetylmuramoyl-L-alanine amidase [Clostridia bacterium]